MKKLLEIRDLTIRAEHSGETIELVSHIDFDLAQRQTLALLGETGSGKSLTALAIQRLLPENFSFGSESKILFENEDILQWPESRMRSLRGRKIGMVFQDPMNALNPVMTVGSQIREAVIQHTDANKKNCRFEIVSLLEKLNFDDPELTYHSFPHQLSGGMKQRVMLAIALSTHPKLLIVDEPTTALDPITRYELLLLLQKLQDEYQFGMLLITHDMQIVTQVADTVIVIEKGRALEQGDASFVLQHTTHPYTRQLVFAPPTIPKPEVAEENPPVLEVREISVGFPIKGGLLGRKRGEKKAVDRVSFSVQEGETLAIIGESGAGKSTLGRSLVALEAYSGEIWFMNNPLHQLTEREMRGKRGDIQFIFQDPFSAMNPRFIVKDIIEEGMLAFQVGSDKRERSQRVETLLTQVGLLPEHQMRYPHELSGGQRQRVCIARALALGPRLLVCDEPTSSLDVRVQSQIIDLLLELQAELEISYVFITHNMATVRAIAHRVIVMKAGQIVEQGSVDQVLTNPSSEYTRTLLAAELI